jgi:hypothetical protein
MGVRLSTECIFRFGPIRAGPLLHPRSDQCKDGDSAISTSIDGLVLLNLKDTAGVRRYVGYLGGQFRCCGLASFLLH